MLLRLLVGLCALACVYGDLEDEGSAAETYKIEGRVVRPDSSLQSPAEWFASTKVFTNGGHLGFLKYVA